MAQDNNATLALLVRLQILLHLDALSARLEPTTI
jgi:hypothetical protein